MDASSTLALYFFGLLKNSLEGFTFERETGETAETATKRLLKNTRIEAA